MDRPAIRFRVKRSHSVAIVLALLIAPAYSAVEASTTKSILVEDFVEALDRFASGEKAAEHRPAQEIWMRGLADRKVDPTFLAKRLQKSGVGRYKKQGIDPLAKFRQIAINDLDLRDTATDSAEGVTAALHAFRIDVEEDYDDVFNDNIYTYFIVTHDDLVWGKVSQIYTGLDEGDSFFFTPEDRGLFGPSGQKLTQKSHLIVDFGIVESDGEDIVQLQRLSSAIVDLALVALTVYDPSAGAAAAQAREETKNLLNLIISMDDDDRLVADTVRLMPSDTQSMLDGTSVREFSRYYARETFWTAFAYRIHFRLLK